MVDQIYMSFAEKCMASSVKRMPKLNWRGIRSIKSQSAKCKKVLNVICRTSIWVYTEITCHHHHKSITLHCKSRKQS